MIPTKKENYTLRYEIISRYETCADTLIIFARLGICVGLTAAPDDGTRQGSVSANDSVVSFFDKRVASQPVYRTGLSLRKQIGFELLRLRNNQSDIHVYFFT